MITRNKETGRFESVKEAPVEQEVATAVSYGYYSKLLNKPFDTVAELKAAEAEFKKAEEEKKQALEAKKAETSVVERAIDAYEEGKVVCNEVIAEAYKEYKAKVEEAEKALATLREEADTKLNAYLEAHPNSGFHYTFRSKDGKVVRNYNFLNKKYAIMDNYDRFAKAVSDLFNLKF